MLDNSVRVYAGFLYNKFALFRMGQRQKCNFDAASSKRANVVFDTQWSKVQCLTLNCFKLFVTQYY